METNAKRLRKYSAISLGIVLVTAFVLVQPTMLVSYAEEQGGVSPGLGAEGIPSFDDCELTDWERHVEPPDFDNTDEEQPEDSMSMETVRSGNKVLTIHVEKETYSCLLNQGGLTVLLHNDIYLQILENMETQEIIATNALATTCMKDEDTAQTIACESYPVPTTPVPVGNRCDNIEEDGGTSDPTKHPQEMNIVKKLSTVKTIVAQKEIFMCGLDELGESCQSHCFDAFDTWKKVDIVIFTDVYKDINTLEDTVKFYEYRCVTLVTNDDNDDNDEDDVRDATVESCIFRQVPT